MACSFLTTKLTLLTHRKRQRAPTRSSHYPTSCWTRFHYRISILTLLLLVQTSVKTPRPFLTRKQHRFHKQKILHSADHDSTEFGTCGTKCTTLEATSSLRAARRHGPEKSKSAKFLRFSSQLPLATASFVHYCNVHRSTTAEWH